MSSEGITIRVCTADDSETKELEIQSDVSSNLESPLERRPSFCLNEEQRMSKSFQERKSDVDGAIEWIVKEIKFLQQQDQDLMKQFVKLRGVLNSIKDQPEDRPQFDRKISLPEPSPWSPMFLDYSITEDSPTTFHRDEVSPGLRRRAHSDFAGTVSHYPLSKLVYDDGFGSEERFENFLI